MERCKIAPRLPRQYKEALELTARPGAPRALQQRHAVANAARGRKVRMTPHCDGVAKPSVSLPALCSARGRVVSGCRAAGARYGRVHNPIQARR